MGSDQGTIGAIVLLKSLTAQEEGREWKLIRFLMSHIGWLLLLFLLGIFPFSNELKRQGRQTSVLLAIFFAYVLALEVFQRVRRRLYHTLLFRMVRIQVLLLSASALVFIAGGEKSAFWFVYLWPLFATAFYFPWAVTGVVYAEVVVFFLVSTFAAAGELASIHYDLLLTNLTVLLVLTIILRLLVESIMRVREAESALHYSELLQEVQQSVDAAVDLQSVLDTILKWAVELVRARDGSLLLLEEDGSLHSASRYRGLAPMGKTERIFTPGADNEGIAGWVARERKPYVCNDTEVDPKFVEIIAGVPIRSLVVVPIVSHGQVLGVISVDSAEAYRFSSDDAEILSVLADQVAAAIERARLLDSLAQIGETTLGGVDPHQQIADATHRLTRCPVALWRIDETGERARIVASCDIRREHVATAWVDLNQSVTGQAIRERRIVEVPDIQAHPIFRHKEEAAREGWRSMLAVPLLVEPEQAVGTLSIYSNTEKEFTQWEMDILRTFAAQAGIAIHHNDLMESERKLRRAFDAISPDLDLEGVANQILDGLSGIVDYKKASLQLIRGSARALLAGRGFDVGTADSRFQRPIPEDPLVRRATAGREPLILSDTSTDPDWEQNDGTSDVASWVGLPLILNQEIIGLITLDHDRAGFYSLDQRELLVSFANQAAINLRKAYLYDSAKRHIRDLEIVNDVVEIIGTKLKTEDLLETVASLIVTHLDCINCALYFPQREHGETVLVPAVTRGECSEETTRRFRSGEGLVGWVFKHGQSLLVDDASADPRFDPEGDGPGQPRPMLIAPVRAGDQTVGVISAEQGEFGRFSHGDRRLVVALARQTGIAIERARALELLEKVGEQILGLRDMDFVLLQIVSGAIELTNTNTGVIHLISDDGRRALRSVHPPGFDHPPPRMDRERGLTRQVIETGKMLQIQDIRGHPDVNPVLWDEFYSMIAIPLMREERVIGVLFLNDKDKHDFTETEVSLLSTLANNAAITIDNARLFLELDERAAQLVRLNEVTATISASPLEREPVLCLIVSSLSEMFSGASCAIRLLDPETGRFGETVVEGAVEETWPDPRPDGASWHVIETREALYLEDAASPSFVGQISVHPELFDRGVRAIAYLPLISRGESIGILYLNLETPHAFSPGERRLLTLFADQAAIAIEKTHLVERLEEMLGEIAHQLFAPITTIRGFISLLVDGKVSDSKEVQGYYETIAEAVEYLGGMTENLLNLRRIEAGVFQLQPGSVAITELVREAINLYRYAAEVKNIKVQLLLQHRAENERITVDREKMIAAIQNLLENAVKYSPNGSIIKVFTDDDEELISITIEDAGIGIPMDEVPLIFDKHFRGRLVKEKKIDGTGIGLTIAKYVVKQHGGRIVVSSEEGRGSTFTIELPFPSGSES